MKDSIYQCIWDADQNENGIQPILDHQAGNEQKGFVKVNTNLEQSNKNLRVLTEVHIPNSKMKTYLLALRLFDNFALRERDEEVDTAKERTEVHDFVEAIIDTAPMQLAREYLAYQTKSSMSRQRWYNTLMEMWFRKFSMGGDPHLSGFEHVIIGEQDGSKAKGYHFWYKYYLDDGFARQQDGIYDQSFPALTDDRISYLGTKMGDDQEQYPETVTISYRWFAPDYQGKALRPLTKPIGGFFVGCSIEGLLAMGTVRGHLGANAPRKARVNGAEYNMALYHSQNKRHIRTFYPKFIRGLEAHTVNVGGASTCTFMDPPPMPSNIRIVAALVNPVGDDVGKESITIINTGSEPVAINNWEIIDKNEKSSSFSVGVLHPGEAYRILLDGRGAQLANSGGGTVKLVNENGEMVHLVSYSEGQVTEEGKTLLF